MLDADTVDTFPIIIHLFAIIACQESLSVRFTITKKQMGLPDWQTTQPKTLA